MATQLLGTVGNIPTITVGGRVFTDISSNLIELVASVAGGGSYATARKMNGNAGYQVTAGKTLTIYAARIIVTTAAAGDAITLMYGTADVGMASSSPPAGIAYLANSTASNTGLASMGIAGYQDVAVNFTIPQNDYPGITSNGGSATVILYGYEA